MKYKLQKNLNLTQIIKYNKYLHTHKNNKMKIKISKINAKISISIHRILTWIIKTIIFNNNYMEVLIKMKINNKK
jgi:hypothetical protein